MPLLAHVVTKNFFVPTEWNEIRDSDDLLFP